MVIIHEWFPSSLLLVTKFDPFSIISPALLTYTDPVCAGLAPPP